LANSVRRSFDRSSGSFARFGALLDRVVGVAAGIGQTDDLGLRLLGLKQE